jgi:hypothetical protein
MAHASVVESNTRVQETTMIVQTREGKSPSAGTTLIDSDARIFQENFDRASFQFSHYLAGHPLFELPRLLELAKGLPEHSLYYDAGDIRVNQRWDETPRTALSVDQLIDRIENSGAWILLKHAEQHPQYAPILDQWMGEVRTLVGAPFPKKTKMRSAVVLITSPRRITTYHIDPDCNYLLQIQGEKVLHVFDRYDRDVLPDEELERFWAGDQNAASYKPHYQDRAKSYAMKPGTGVHIPVNAGHWVQNADNISVSLSMIFQFPDSHLGNIYRWNYYLRKAGMRPLPPGRSKARDVLKTWTMEGAIRARKTVGMLGRNR